MQFLDLLIPLAPSWRKFTIVLSLKKAYACLAPANLFEHVETAFSMKAVETAQLITYNSP